MLLTHEAWARERSFASDPGPRPRRWFLSAHWWPVPEGSHVLYRVITDRSKFASLSHRH
ncbi:hypothetical protein HMPREF1980_02200 [Actinomyces sp. oral taxon 172 str. F0311]|nr:hypothetical protein HMPREF1980_02200 [Actinomyces sp. oral taxon 172 str. F0311]